MPKTFETLLQEYKAGTLNRKPQTEQEDSPKPRKLGWQQADSKPASEVRFITFEISRYNEHEKRWEAVTKHSARSLGALEGEFPHLFCYEGEYQIRQV